MAKPTTLQDKVARNSKLVSGQQTEPVQQLATNKGLSAAPVTAYGTALIGGSPQQAKMAGTPAQKAAALQPTIAAPTGETQLETAQAIGTAKETAADVAKKREAAQYASALGTYGDKVNQWIEAAKQKLVGTTAVAQVDASDKILAGLDAGKKAQAIDILKQLATTTDLTKQQQLELQLNQTLGRNINSILSTTEKGELYQNVASSIQAATAAGQEAVLGADRKLTLSDMSQLGTTQTELATLLKMPEAEVGNLTLSQLQQKIATISQQDFGTTQAVHAGLSSRLLSSADQAALRSYLRDVETVGVAGSEAAVAQLADQIDKNHSIQFAGTRYSIEELFASPAFNDVVKQAIADYESPTQTGTTLEALKTKEPSTYKWLMDNYAGVKTLLDQQQGVSKTFADTQAANKAALSVIADKQPQLAKDLGFDPEQLRAEKIDPASLPGVFQAIAAITDPGARDSATSVLAQLNSTAGADQIKNLTKEQVEKLDLNNPNGPAAQYLNAAKDIQSTKNHTDINDVMKDISSGDESPEQVNMELSGDSLATALGLPPSNAKQLDSNNDGKIDARDVNFIKSKITSSLPNLSEIAAGQKPTLTTNQWTFNRPTYGGEGGLLFNAIQSAMKDGKIDDGELAAIQNLPLSPEYLKGIYDKSQSRLRNISQTALWGAIPDGLKVRNALLGRYEVYKKDKDRADQAAKDAAKAAAAKEAADKAAADEAERIRAEQQAEQERLAESQRAMERQDFRVSGGPMVGMEEFQRALPEAPGKVEKEAGKVQKAVTKYFAGK